MVCTLHVIFFPIMGMEFTDIYSMEKKSRTDHASRFDMIRVVSIYATPMMGKQFCLQAQTHIVQ